MARHRKMIADLNVIEKKIDLLLLDMCADGEITNEQFYLMHKRLKSGLIDFLESEAAIQQDNMSKRTLTRKYGIKPPTNDN